MLLLNSPISSTIGNSKYSCYSDSGMSTMGWQSHQHPHQHQQCNNAHPVQTVQHSQVQSLGVGSAGAGGQVGGYPGAGHPWGMKGSVPNGAMMANNYPAPHNGIPMANMTNYGPQPNDPYSTGCATAPMHQKMYNAPNNSNNNNNSNTTSSTTTTTKGTTGAG